MLDYWTALSYTTRFSVIACVVTFPLGLLSMGALGGILYYPVSLVLPAYPTLNDWRGDWVWPATLFVGMGWSVGFLLAGLAWFYLAKGVSSVVLLRIVYALVLYGWAAFLWWVVVRKQF
jgi:hypothetical protein